MDQNSVHEKKKHLRFPGGRARLWQMGICLVLFIAALFFRAVTGKELVPTMGAQSLREMAEHAGQVLARSEIVEAFADGFRSAVNGEATSTVIPAAASYTVTTTFSHSAVADTSVAESGRSEEHKVSTLPLLTKAAYAEP